MPKAILSQRAPEDPPSAARPAQHDHAAEEPVLRRRRIRWAAKADAPAGAVPDPTLRLSSRAIACLLQRLPGRSGEHGPAEAPPAPGLRVSPARMLKLAAACTRAELLAMRGIGIGTVDEIEQWLDAHGCGFRPDPDALTTALGRAIEHLEAVVETHSDEALLQAFLALPALKKALRAAPGKRTHLRRPPRCVPADHAGPGEARRAARGR